MEYESIGVSFEPKIIGVNNGIYQIEIDESCFKSESDFEDYQNYLESSPPVEELVEHPIPFLVLKKQK